MSTMQAIVGRSVAGLITPNRSNAQSKQARQLLSIQEDIREYLLGSYTVRDPRERLLNELDDLLAEASLPGWDGHSGKPLDIAAYDFARMLIRALPTTAPLPEVSADPDGEVSLDWSFGYRRALTVSVGPTGRCAYAWVLGQETNRGTAWIDDEIPESITFKLHQLAPAKMAGAVR